MHLLKLLCFLSIFFIQQTPISSQPNSITLYNDASFNANNNSISLTNQNCTAPSNGRAFYGKPVWFLDPSTNATLSFSCNFTFTITNSPSCPFGNGIEFIITSDVEEIGSDQTRFSYFAVVFNTSFDHVSVNVNGVKSLASVDVMSRYGISLKDGKEIGVWIEYKDSEKMVHVWVDYLKSFKPKNLVIALRIDLSNLFKEFMHVGFAASNGRGSSSHDVGSWRFRPLNEVVSSGLPVEEGECLVCSRNNDTVSGDIVDFVTDHSSGKGFSKLALVLGSVSFVLVLIGVLVILCLCMKRKRIRRARTERSSCMSQDEGMVPTMLSLNEIRSATNGFDESTVIGEGASSVVYQGAIPAFGRVAVKRFNNEGNFDSSSVPFKNEFGTMVGFLKHKNLVQLRGCCYEGNEVVLVYEHLANGSLDRILHTRTNLSKYLTWERRMNIIQGVASALVYIHEQSQIIHREIKTSNILLDSELNGKLGDIRLTDACRHSIEARESIPDSIVGYFAPEYLFTGVPTSKTNIYSFGVVILEVATGRYPIDVSGVKIRDYVRGLWEKGNICEAADPKLNGNFNGIEMERVLVVGLLCAHFIDDRRPTMKEAARMLRGEAPLPFMLSKKPAVGIQSVLPVTETYDDIMSLDDESTVDESQWGTPRTHFSKY